MDRNDCFARQNSVGLTVAVEEMPAFGLEAIERSSYFAVPKHPPADLKRIVKMNSVDS